MQLLKHAEQLRWLRVPQQAIHLAEKCAGIAKTLRKAIESLPQDGFLDLWYCHDRDALKLNVGDWIDSDNLDQWLDALRPLVGGVEVLDEAGGPGDDEEWVKIAMRPLIARHFLEKQSVSPMLAGTAQLLGFRPGVIPGAPTPLAAGLATGLLGAGLGYGAGWVGEQLMPETWERGKLRSTLAGLGGLAGVTPAAIWAMINARSGLPLNSGKVMQGPVDTVQSHIPGHPGYTRHVSTHTIPEVQDFYKKSNSQTGFNAPWPQIDVPEIHATVHFDPRVSPLLPGATRAATSGLLAGAQRLAGGTRFITPLDVARMTAGMGSGYLSGMLVGKALGALTGMPPATQEKVKNTGLYAGAIANLLPIAFGGSR